MSQASRTLAAITTTALLAAASLTTTGCSRDHIKAVELSNEAQKSLKSSPRAAIEKLEEAKVLAPADHVILDMLGAAYRKEKKWAKAASTMAEARTLAKDYASYAFWQGYALIQQAEKENGKKSLYEDAKQPLEACIKLDANYAECHYWLGYADYHTGANQSAAKNFTSAIEHDPTEGYFYFDLVELYITYKLYKEAGQVIKAAEDLVPPTEKNAKKLVALYMFKFEVARQQGDMAGAVVALESAQKIEPKNPDINYALGSTYAVLKPPKREKAARLLKAFDRKVCKGSGKKKRAVQCQQASVLLRDLEGK